MKDIKRANKNYGTSRLDQPQIRVYHKKSKDEKSPRYLLKCGCCEQRVEIYYTKDGLEINVVNGSIENWREILLP